MQHQSERNTRNVVIGNISVPNLSWYDLNILVIFFKSYHGKIAIEKKAEHRD